MHNLTFCRKFYRYGSNTSKAPSNPSTARQLERLNLPLSPRRIPSASSIFQHAVPVELPVKAQMPAVFRLPASAAILCCLLRCEDFAHQVCSLGGGLTDLHACCFQSFLLRLSGTGGTGDNSACVAHVPTNIDIEDVPYNKTQVP